MDGGNVHHKSQTSVTYCFKKEAPSFLPDAGERRQNTSLLPCMLAEAFGEQL